MIRAHIYFTGTVQGVGFRYTCRSYAVDLGLKGWVKNLPDGRVELWVEGAKDLIGDLVQKLTVHFGGYIHKVQAEYLNAKNECTNFEIAF